MTETSNHFSEVSCHRSLSQQSSASYLSWVNSKVFSFYLALSLFFSITIDIWYQWLGKANRHFSLCQFHFVFSDGAEVKNLHLLNPSFWAVRKYRFLGLQISRLPVALDAINPGLHSYQWHWYNILIPYCWHLNCYLYCVCQFVAWSHPCYKLIVVLMWSAVSLYVCWTASCFAWCRRWWVWTLMVIRYSCCRQLSRMCSMLTLHSQISYSFRMHHLISFSSNSVLCPR